jgi:hypothetical protein
LRVDGKIAVYELQPLSHDAEGELGSFRNRLGIKPNPSIMHSETDFIRLNSEPKAEAFVDRRVSSI